MKNRIIALLLLITLAACGEKDNRPTIQIMASRQCEETSEVMIKMTQACATGGGKYPEDCMKAAVQNFCPSLTGYYVSTGDYQTSAWRPCSQARAPEAKAACAVYEK